MGKLSTTYSPESLLPSKTAARMPKRASQRERGMCGVESAVEPALAYHGGGHVVAVLVEEEAASVHVGAEEGAGDEGHRVITSAVEKRRTWGSSW